MGPGLDGTKAQELVFSSTGQGQFSWEKDHIYKKRDQYRDTIAKYPKAGSDAKSVWSSEMGWITQETNSA